MKELSIDQLYLSHRAKIYEQVYAMTHSRWHAEEIVQDVFLRVWIHRDKISSVKDIDSWLFIITKRFVFDYIRKKYRQEKFFSSYKYTGSVSECSDSLLPLQCQRLMAEGLRSLSPRERDVFHLKHMRGLDRVAIARQLNISEPTAVHYIKGSMYKLRRFVCERLAS